MITVIGDSIRDIYIYGTVDRISPESPIPIFKHSRQEEVAGGSGNVVANLKALGEEVEHYCNSTSTKHRFVCDNHILFRYDDEKYEINPVVIYPLNYSKYVILSDYNKGFLHNSQQIINNLKSQGAFVIVDPKKSLDNYKNADIIKLNWSELKKFGNGKSAIEILVDYNIGALVITMGANGVMIADREDQYIIYADKHEVSDVTGAGDVFIAAMTHFLKQGHNLHDSCVKATKLASVSVTKFGTYVLTEEDIKKTKIVFTNGCFDILHRGHIEYLKQSKELGYKLVVGLNSDASVKKLKGESRPVNNQYDRKAVLEALDCVDEVIIFDEVTPYELIKKIKPDIITKGGDYTAGLVIGNDLADVVIIPLVEDYSTTKILSGK